MKYPHHWKVIGVRIMFDREVYYRDVFEGRDVLAGKIESRRVEGAKSPGGMTTDTVWTGTRVRDGASAEFKSKTAAVDFVLSKSPASY